jgi:anaerobic carbon-monoxide dehydrogenase iron sulfur subunit
MKKIYVNEEACMGCGLCRVYCLAEHSKTQDIVKAFKKESPRPLPRIRVERNGEVSFSLQCRHCDEPWCVYSCLTGAMHQDKLTGTITVDEEKCTGCWTCIVACPNGALTRDGDRKVVSKCDLCPGSEVPACVANCPNEALVFIENGVVKELTGVKS